MICSRFVCKYISYTDENNIYDFIIGSLDSAKIIEEY
jgi:hypothetical protein